MSFHEFNPFTGRLKESTRPQPLYPVLPRPLKNIETPTMIYDSIKTKPLKTMLPGQSKYSTLNPKMAKLYKMYQADLTIPSYLLAGTRDKILYRAICAATAISFVVNMYNLVRLSQK